MATLVRWDPFADMRGTLDKLFDEGFSRPWRVVSPSDYEGAGFAMEMSQSDDAVDVKAALPGTSPEDVEVSVANDVLTIKAQHKEEETEDQKRQYYRREIRYGTYHRAMSLPVSVDADKAEAHFENGYLYLKLPKAESLRPKQIKVSGNGPAIEAPTA